ncbi:sulfotransferase family protein [Glycomyces tarimensis]
MHRVAPWLKAINVMLAPTIANRRNKVDKIIDRAVREAEAKTDGTASGDERFIEDMRFLLGCFADVEGLTPTGWMGTSGDIASRMENRFRIRKLHAQHPEIADEPIKRPIVVVGMPRTGTTLTHYALAEPAGHRAPLMWELLHTDVGEAEREERIRHAERFVKAAETASPQLPVMHKMGAEKPEECIFILPHGVAYLVRAPLPRYEQWMLERDYTADYQYLKQALQVLQHGREPRRWVLKSPAHLWNLDTLLTVFPDAQVVWTHRELHTVMGSLGSLAENSMSMHVRRPDPHLIGRKWLGLLATGIGRATDSRRRLPADAIIDVPYRHLVDEPMRRLPELFERLGADWGERERAALERLVARPRGGSGHTYDLARYGLSDADLDQAFGDYGRFVAELG